MRTLRPISNPLTPPKSQMVNSLGEKLLLRPSRTTSAPQNPTLQSTLVSLPTNPPKVLDFDIETRRVGFHSGFKGKPDGCEPIAIACSWVGEKKVHSILLGDSGGIPHMIEWFLEFYNEADIVTGHYIRKFDLPILNMASLEWGGLPFPEKRTQDTKMDLINFEGISKSQENLGKMLRTVEGKYHMADADWRRAARLTQGGQRRARLRAEHDVKQHKQLRKLAIERGMLRWGQVWSP